MRRHRLERADVAYADLAEELSAALGVRVGVAATAPVHAEDGVGVLVVLDGVTGEYLDVDGGIVARVLRAHVPPAPPPDPFDELEAALAGVDSVVKLRDALTDYARGERKRRGGRERLSNRKERQ